MPSARSLDFNRQPYRSRTAVEQLARTDEEGARRYLTTMGEALRATGRPWDADRIENLSRAPNLAESIVGSSRLNQIFTAAQPYRIGWEAGEMPWRPMYLPGTMGWRGEGDHGLVLHTPGGRQLDVVAGSSASDRMGPNQLQFYSFIHEGPVNVKGVLGNDGRSIKIEAACPALPGFETFEAGRVEVPNGPFGDIVVRTTRGDFFVTHPEMRRQLGQFYPETWLGKDPTNFGVILSGEATRVEGGRRYYDADAPFFALTGLVENLGDPEGRPPTRLEPGADWTGGQPWVRGNMAQSHARFHPKAIVLPEELLSKVRLAFFDRIWVLGRFEFNEGNDEDPIRLFRATYLTGQADQGVVGPIMPDAPALLTATRAAEALSPDEPAAHWAEWT